MQGRKAAKASVSAFIMSLRVVPVDGEGVLSLSNMNPDFNNDGVVDEMEKAVYERMLAADADGDGYLTRAEVYTVIATATTELREAQKGGIPISTLNPDTDGDGKIEKWEKEVFERIKDADADHSGAISVKELFSVIKGAAASDRAKRMFRNLLIVAVLIIFLLIGAMLGMGIVAGEAVKESKVPSCADPTTPGCSPAGLVRAGSVESFVPSLFDLPTAPTESLAYMLALTTYVDMTSSSAVGGAVEATFKIAGAYKRSDTLVFLETVNGHTLAIDAAAQTATITMDGVTYPVSDTMPASGRRLETAVDAPMLATLTERQLAEHHEERRRKLSFAGALMTSGSFTMMASSARRLSPGPAPPPTPAWPASPPPPAWPAGERPAWRLRAQVGSAAASSASKAPCKPPAPSP